MMKQILLLAFLVGVGWAVPGGSASAQAPKESTERLRAAARKVDITPTRAAYLAGYEPNRKSSDVHDHLMARCLVLQSGESRVAFVSCDLIGTPRYMIQKIRAQVKSIAPTHLIISATHTHSGPDILGMWGPALNASGVDQEWMAATIARIAALVDQTASELKPAALKFANTTDVPRISKNIRVPRILDRELGVMQVVSPESGKPICTFVNYACHPEILDTHSITADFPHWLYETVEGGGGGVCLYLNGAQGGMITADYDESTAPKGQNWQAAEAIGTSMGACVLKLIEAAPMVKSAPITVQQRVFMVPLENQRYKALIALKVFPSEGLKNGDLETEVSRITIGSAEFLTIPGEALPNVGFYLKSFMQGHPKFLLGLTGDFLGYILTPEDFGLDLYGYESGQSVGQHIEPLLVQNLRALMPATSH